MKKFKIILSIALICVLTLGGGVLLTGCDSNDNRPIVNITNKVINDISITTIKNDTIIIISFFFIYYTSLLF